MIRRPKPPKHKRTRNELRKTAPNAVHEQNPPGTKFAMKILKRIFNKHQARQKLGLDVTKVVTPQGVIHEDLPLAMAGDNGADVSHDSSHIHNAQS